jgi:hypothetical protein
MNLYKPLIPSTQNENSWSVKPTNSWKQQKTKKKCHKLSHKWGLWAHRQHDRDWTINSYKPLASFNTLENAIEITETLPKVLILYGMLFIMRDGITPIWEDQRNRNGGCFSYKIPNNNAPETWKRLTYMLTGNTLSSNIKLCDHINGVTISPKKNFCVVKIWMATDEYRNPEEIAHIEGIDSTGCTFRKHMVSY